MKISRIFCRFILKFIVRNPIKKAKLRGINIGDNCKIIKEPNWGSEPWLISIGNHVEISFDVAFITHDGATWNFRNKKKYEDVIRYGTIIVKDNCFIGARTTILPGVIIGPNSIVGACSLVNKDVAPNSVYAGIPARRICSIEEYAEKCRRETPHYNKTAYQKNKKQEILRILNGRPS